MSRNNILFISGSIGLGHVTRDLEIARALRQHIADLEFSWIAAGPAKMILRDAGENVVPAASQWIDYMYAVDNLVENHSVCGKVFRGNIFDYVMSIQKYKDRNVDVFKRFMGNHQFDLVIGDETFEIAYALRTGHVQMEPTFVMITDFIGYESMSRRIKENALVYVMNRKLVRDYERIPASEITCFFIGELEDVPDRRFGFLLPNRRDHVKKRHDVLGYVVRFDPAGYEEQEKIRAKLGYGSEKLVVCSIGGTAIGKVLLELCGKSYHLIKEQIPDLRMVMVCGPCLAPEDLDVPPGIDVRGYVPDLFEHFAACDLAIVMGGGTTTIELTALKIPFLYFPVEEHFEQAIYIADRLDRHRAGVRMWYSETSPESLASAVVANLGKEVHHEPIRIDGAQRAARLIGQLLEG